MTTTGLKTHGGAVALYMALAVVFTWPLPLHLSDSFLGQTDGDLGVYIWNIWVFRHEIVVHHAFPFFTLEILSLTDRLPLSLQNYTTFWNLLAFPFIPSLGIVVTFNVLVITNSALAAYAMFVYALRRTNDVAAALLAGILFGFSPFMTARSVEHVSLSQAAPLPVFGLLMFRLAQNPSRRLSALAGLVVGWAFLCDPYYAVYCLFVVAVMLGYSMVTVDFRPEPLRRKWWTTLVDVALLSVLGLIASILLRGGGRVDFLGLRISFFRLYTPVFIFTVLLTLRAWIAVKPRIVCTVPSWRYARWLLAPAALALALVLAPLFYPLLAAAHSSFPSPGRLPWQNSAPGLDLLAYLVPNPFNPWLGSWSMGWLGRQANGFTENVASIPFVVLVALAAATARNRRWAHPRWITFTLIFAVLSLGPFLKIGGLLTYVPGPWAFVRYLPLIGAARMPTRLAVLTFMGMSMLLAMAVRSLRERTAWRTTVTVAVGVLLVIELYPGQRPLYSAEIPSIYRVIAADPRPTSVLNLPFGLRDGLSSAGNHSAEYQFHQTTHEKPLVGGYVSRLPRGEVKRYRRIPVMSALIDLSEGRAIGAEEQQAAIATARESARTLNVGWVVVDTRLASRALEALAVDAFGLMLVQTDGPWKLYKTALPD